MHSLLLEKGNTTLSEENIGTKYIENLKFLSSKFDPREISIISTDYNRTIMSAYSEINGWYPMGLVQQIRSAEKRQAVPPFSVTNLTSILKDLKKNPTPSAFQPMPIHVGQGSIDNILRAQSASVCPVVKKFQALARKEAGFSERNKVYKDNIFKAISENWGIKNNNDFISVSPYTDGFDTSFFDDRLIEKYTLPIEYVDRILADKFYFYTFFFDEMVRIASTHFLNFLYSTFDAKIKAITTKNDDGSGMKRKKLIFISAHDSSIAAFLSGIEQKQMYQSFFATHNMIELWKNKGTLGNSDEDYYVKWLYNDVALNINNDCDEGKCPYVLFKEFLKSREYQGEDWEKDCLNISESWTGPWLLVAGIAAGVFICGTISYFVIKRIFISPKN